MRRLPAAWARNCAAAVLASRRGALLYMGCRNARGGREGWLVAARRGAAGPAVIALTDDGKHGRETIRNHDHMHRLLAPTYSHLTPCAQVEVWR